MITRIASVCGIFAASAAALAQDKPSPRPWTILVYAAADNNADGPVLEFLDSVRKAIDDDPGLDVLLLIDRSDGYSSDATMLGEDFTGARLFRLRRDSAERLAGGAHFPGITLDKDAEIDSSDAANIGRFIAWGKAQSPAERYALLIYSHADGRTMCPDEQSKREMGIAELTDEADAPESVDFLALELCNMGGIEIAYQWRPGNGGFGADVLLAIPNAGPPLDWHLAFGRIRSPGHEADAERPPVDPASMTAADFGRLVIEEGYEGRLANETKGRGTPKESAAAYDLRAASAVKESVDALARALAASDSRTAFTSLRDGPDGAAMNYSGRGPYIDLYDLCTRAADSDALSENVRAGATRVMEQVDRFVIASFGMSAYKGFEPGRNGVFVVLPPPEPGRWKQLTWYTPRPGEGEHYGRWSFLRDGATEDNGVVENWFELLDSWCDEPGGGVNGYRP